MFSRKSPLPLNPTGRLWRIGMLTVVVLAWVAAGFPRPAAGEVDPFRALPAGAVAPDPYFNTLFTRYGGGWTGGDGTYSVRLPDGRTVWIFGDSFVGKVAADRSRPKPSHLVNNCFVLQQADDLITLHGGTAGNPRALVGPPDDEAGFYWPGDGTVTGNLLSVFFNRFRRTGEGPWQWRWLGTEIVVFRLPDIQRVFTLGVDATNGVMYGSAIFEDGSNIYVYGTEDLQRTKYLHLARVPARGLKQAWQYFTGTGWSAEAGKSSRLLAGVANQFSVLEVDRRYLLLTTDNRRPFAPSIVTFVAASPTGPWTPGVRLYTPPEARGEVVAYNALAHPQFSENGRLLVSYNLNHAEDVAALYRNADLYRPRFIRVQLNQLVRCLPDQ
jgi:hypothetical protein